MTQPMLIMPDSREHKIKVRLAIIGISQSELAKCWRMQGHQLSTWIRSDHRRVRRSTMKRLGDLIGMSMDEVIDTTSWDGIFNPIPEKVQKFLDKGKDNQIIMD